MPKAKAPFKVSPKPHVMPKAVHPPEAPPNPEPAPPPPPTNINKAAEEVLAWLEHHGFVGSEPWNTLKNALNGQR